MKSKPSNISGPLNLDDGIKVNDLDIVNNSGVVVGAVSGIVSGTISASATINNAPLWTSILGSGIGKGQTYLGTGSTGNNTLVSDPGADQNLLIVVTVTTAFDAKTGAAPIFKIGDAVDGQTGEDKFMANDVLTDKPAGFQHVFTGELANGKIVNVHRTQRTGDGEGDINVVAFIKTK